jgi:hypothetical protein
VAIVAVNDGSEAWRGTASWEVVEATSGVFAPDFDGARIGLPMPPDADARLAVPRSRGTTVAQGEITFDAAPTAADRIGEVTVALEPGQARTLLVRWADPELDASREQENFVHFHCPAEGEEHGPGLTNV